MRAVATFRLPTGLGCLASTFGHRVAAHVGALTGELLLPDLALDDDRPISAPALPSDIDPTSLRHYADDEAWADFHEWYMDPDRRGRSAGHVRRVAFDFPDLPDGGVTYIPLADGRRGYPEGEIFRKVQYDVMEWCARLCRWSSVVTGQDLDLDSIPSANDHLGFQMWAVDDEGPAFPWHSRTLTVRAVVGESRCLTIESLRFAVERTNAGEDPPLEHALLVDGRWAWDRAQHRRAAVDAGTACELALQRILDDQLAALSDRARAAIVGEGRTLGRLVETVRKLVDLPVDLTPGLVKVRNRAVHRGATIDASEAQRAIELAEDVVWIASPLPFRPAPTKKGLDRKHPD